VVSKDLSLEELFKELGKQVRTIPQIVIDSKHIGGYNELIEHFINKGKINFKGEKIEEEKKI
jgi:glutaredoxin